jgi:hypothetical protein
MELNEAQYQQIEHCLPRQRGNVSQTNLLVLNVRGRARLQVARSGQTLRQLAHDLHAMNRWSKSGVLAWLAWLARPLAPVPTVARTRAQPRSRERAMGLPQVFTSYAAECHS